MHADHISSKLDQKSKISNRFFSTQNKKRSNHAHFDDYLRHLILRGKHQKKE